MDCSTMKPTAFRELVRSGRFTGQTSGVCNGYAQANLVILPKDLAFDFLLFATRNPKPCPILDVTEVGNPEPRLAAPGADLRYDIPKYRIYRHGEMAEEVATLEQYWRDDLVAFLLGCSFSFEGPLLDAGLEVRHITEGHNVPMYITNRECIPAGVFHGPTVVSMRPMKMKDPSVPSRSQAVCPTSMALPFIWGTLPPSGSRTSIILILGNQAPLVLGKFLYSGPAA